jgi:hypothetical protein
MSHHQNALEALAQLSAVAGLIDTAECKDEGLYNRLQSALAVADATVNDAIKHLAAAPVQAQEPVAYLIRENRMNNPPTESCSVPNNGWSEWAPTSKKHGDSALKNGYWFQEVKPLFLAPVQPVAVSGGQYTFPIGEDSEYMILNRDSLQVGTVLYYHDAKVIAAALAAPAAQGDATQAAIDVLEERKRQIESEGWTPETDDKYTREELCFAADAYLMAGDGPHEEPPTLWPWESFWWKPSGNRRNMVKACALILAEIERIDRAAIAAKAAS